MRCNRIAVFVAGEMAWDDSSVFCNNVILRINSIDDMSIACSKIILVIDVFDNDFISGAEFGFDSFACIKALIMIADGKLSTIR